MSPPESPATERVKSALDGPKRVLSVEASDARDMARAASIIKSPTAQLLPQVRASDSEEMRHVKRKVLARDQEIRDAVGKLTEMSERLARLVDQFSSSVVADDIPALPAVAVATPSATSPVAAFSESAASTPTHTLKGDAEGTQKKERRSASSSMPTSLEAILAAARSGQPRTGGGRQKYATMLRDLE